MELNLQEKSVIEFYKNYTSLIKDPKNALVDEKWTKNGTKEKTWVQIYQKLPINPALESLLFISYDEKSVLDELDTLTSKL